MSYGGGKPLRQDCFLVYFVSHYFPARLTTQSPVVGNRWVSKATWRHSELVVVLSVVNIALFIYAVSFGQGLTLHAVTMPNGLGAVSPNVASYSSLPACQSCQSPSERMVTQVP